MQIGAASGVQEWGTKGHSAVEDEPLCIGLRAASPLLDATAPAQLSLSPLPSLETDSFQPSGAPPWELWDVFIKFIA